MRFARQALTALSITLAATLPSLVGHATETFEDHFDNGIDPELWAVWSSHENYIIDDSGSDVLLANPYGGDGWGHFDDVGLCFRGRLHGDFDISVEYSELLLEHPDPAVSCDAANSANLGVSFGIQDLSAERRFFAPNEEQTAISWVAPPDEWQGERPCATVEGTFQIIRTGAEVTTYVNGDMIVTGTFNQAPATGACIRLANWGGWGKVSVRFDDFSVTAGTIEYPIEALRQVVATTAENQGGGNIAIDIDTANREAAIAFTDPDSGALNVVRGTQDGPTWVWGQGEYVADEGQGVDLAYDACGDLWMSFLTPGRRGTINLAHCTSATAPWSVEQIDNGYTGYVTSLAFTEGQCGPPSVAYKLIDRQDYQLKYAQPGLPPVVVESSRDYRGYPSLGFGPDGEPAIAYALVDPDCCRSIRIASRSSDTWASEIVQSYDGGNVRDVSLAFQGGSPVIAYTDAYWAPLTICEHDGGWQCEELNPGMMSGVSLAVSDSDELTLSAAKWDAIWIYRRQQGATDWQKSGFYPAAADDSAVDPNGNPAFCAWYREGLYLTYFHTGTCSVDSHCDDANPCTTDFCSATGHCEYVFLADGTACGGDHDICCSGSCFPRNALYPTCNDGDVCTLDSYVAGGNPPCSSYCLHEPIPGCGTCTPKGQPCTTNEECCSGLCHPTKHTCK